MSRFHLGARSLLVLAVLGSSSCGYKGKLYLPEEAESNQPQAQVSDPQTDDSSSNEEQ